MDNKTTYAVAAVVVIILVAGIAAVALTGGEDTKDGDKVTFLVMDDDGMYFWADGYGNNVYEAFVDATETYEMPFTPTKDAEGVAYGIDSLFGLAMDQKTVEGKTVWTWWQQLVWDGSSWAVNGVGMLDTTAADTNGYFAVVYGSSVDVAKLPQPKDAVVWDKSTDGMVFTIQNGDNLFFKVNGQGETAMDAFVDACDTYKIPHEFTGGEANPSGINWLFNEDLCMQTHSITDYTYWVQYYKNTGDADWVMGEMTMDNMKVEDYNECLIKYEFFSFKS